jgi:hypothetical protein
MAFHSWWALVCGKYYKGGITGARNPRSRKTMSKVMPWVVAMLASITSVSFHIDAQGVKIELKRTQEQLASLQNDNFGLASAACVE